LGIGQLFNRIFPKTAKTQNLQTKMRLFESNDGNFNSFGQELYNSDIVRESVHVIASNVAKLKPVHVRRKDGDITTVNSYLERMLQFRPNDYVNAYDFLYKLTTQYLLKNNAFIYIKTNNLGQIEGFFNVRFSSVDIVDVEGTLYAKFQYNGRIGVCPYEELIHLRRHFNDNDFFGDGNFLPLYPALELINTGNQGIINAIQKSAKLRGLLKFTQSMLKPEDIKKQRDDFIKDYLDISNDGGIAAIDAKAEYQELKADYKVVDDKQMVFTEEKIYKYFNVNKAIVQSNYTEEEWNAFYENVVEPIAIQLSLEFTNKLFSKTEQGFGNEIVFEANRLQYASATTKINLVRDLAPLGMFTINECREIFNLAPVEGGDKRIQTLNVVDASKANDYQGIGKGGENNGQNGAKKSGTNSD